MERAKRLDAARRALARAEESVGLAETTAEGLGSAGEWALPDGLAWLFPRGLSRGMTVGVHGSRLATLFLVGIVSGAGAWSVFLGCEGTGWAMAENLGVDLHRTACVTEVDERTQSQALAAAIDGFDVVVIGSSIRLGARERRLLAKRALTRSCLLIGEGWKVRDCLEGKLIAVEGIDRGVGHISMIRFDIGRIGGRSRTLLIGANGWKPAVRALEAPPTSTAPPNLAPPSLRAVSACRQRCG